MGGGGKAHKDPCYRRYIVALFRKAKKCNSDQNSVMIILK